MINHIFLRDTLVKTPWKNGGGVTREIAKSEPDAPFWRVSIADVSQEGPFSKFLNLTRILTVIDGQGMVLSSPHKEIEAALYKPVEFTGDDEISGKLPYGPIQDFNLIYDANCYDARVDVLPDAKLERARPSGYELHIIYCLTGSVSLVNGHKLLPHRGILNPSEGLKPGAETAMLLEVRLSSRR